MAAVCGEVSVLTGSDGALYVTPAGTTVCLLDHTDFPAGTEIKVPANDYRVGDPIVFAAEGAAKLDSALTAGTTYYVVSKGQGTVTVSDTKGGTPVTLNGDGGTNGNVTGVLATITPPALPTTGVTYGAGPHDGIAGTTTTGTGTGATFDVTVVSGDVTAVAVGTAKGRGYKAGDTITIPGDALGAPAGTGDIVLTVASVTTSSGVGVDTAGAHINVEFAEFAAVCQVGNVEVSFTRGEIDTTSLPCGVKVAQGGVKIAGFRTYQPGYAEGSGSMTVRFTDDNASIANRMIQNALFSNQSGARLKVYLNAVADSAGLKPDDAASLLVEFPVSLLGFSFGVSPEDTPTEASINFRMSGAPTQLLGL